MSFRINTNLYAQSAWGNLSQANGKIGESIQKLSSGLRINKAADDASGLAISEKLRGQIRGLGRATMNAQDGISMLQTAEGGMSEITNMVQRMRELAIQAGNGTYTAGDRAELQKEVDQLLAEVDRIATSTEFNTKKLLNGDAAALWSSDSPKVQGIVRSAVTEGNYTLETELTNVGSNTVYGTQIMSLNEGAIGAEIRTDGADTANETNVGLVKDPVSLNATGTSYYTVSVAVSAAAAVTATGTVNGSYLQSGSSWNVTDASIGVTTTTGQAAGYFEVEFLNTSTVETAGSSIEYRLRFIDAKTGTATDWHVTGVTTAASISTAALSLSVDATAAKGFVVTGQIDMSAAISFSDIQKGDKLLFAANTTVANVAYSASGAGSLQVAGGTEGVTGPRVLFSSAGSLVKADNGDTTVDYNDVTLYQASMDASTGNLDVGNVTFSFQESISTVGATFSGGQTFSGDFTFAVNGGGEAATSTTYLKDIAVFTNDDGRNIMENTQTLTIYGNGNQVDVYLEGNDTIADLENKLTSAIVNGLGMGANSDVSTEASTINGNLVNFVASGDTQTNTNESVAGTFVIQTALLGDQSGLTFVGDQGLIDGLGMNVVAEGENSALTVTVTNAANGDLIGSDTVTDNMLRGVVEGMDIQLQSNTGLNLTWDSANKNISFAALGTNETLNLHVIDNSTQLQVGASEGQSFDVSIFEVSAVGLEIEDISVVNQDVAGAAVTKLDSALVQINGARATIGAQINRLQSTIVNQNTARENLMAAESRIRDLDIASEMTSFTKNQMMVQASTAMLAQANQLPQIAMQLLG